MALQVKQCCSGSLEVSHEILSLVVFCYIICFCIYMQFVKCIMLMVDGVLYKSPVLFSFFSVVCHANHSINIRCHANLVVFYEDLT